MTTSWIEIASFLSIPFLTCIVLAGIHCYLGIHVLKRGVIFVDLSLAQVAAFGTTFALLLGFDQESSTNYFISLSFTFLAALLFSLGRKLEKKIPQEALIGVVYALCSAAVILCIDRISHGTEHIKNVLVGQILFVSSSELMLVCLIYSLVAIVHYVFRSQFFAASEGNLVKNQGLWDFIFYALFGVIITSSVKIVGVLQVFSYLIVPSIVSSWFTKSIKARLLLGWAFGAIMSFIGILWSYSSDLPTGAAIVVCFTITPILLVLVSNLLSTVKR